MFAYRIADSISEKWTNGRDELLLVRGLFDAVTWQFRTSGSSSLPPKQNRQATRPGGYYTFALLKFLD
jgi:hypothetical protein